MWVAIGLGVAANRHLSAFVLGWGWCGRGVVVLFGESMGYEFMTERRWVRWVGIVGIEERGFSDRDLSKQNKRTSE